MENGRQRQNGRVKQDSATATAGIIIVGDEILKGHVQDANSHYLCRQLWLCSVRVCKVAVVADDCDAIAEEVRRFASAYDYVLTTGGVGPTHDDVTLQAIAKAFNEECVVHPEILGYLSHGEEEEEEDDSVRKMATVPKSAVVHVSPACPFFLVCAHNVHCYPGIPSLLQDLFQTNKGLYRRADSAVFYLRELFVSCDEDILVRPLTLVQSEYPSVQLGSYPDTTTTASRRVKITLESSNTHTLDKAYTRLALLLPKDVMMSALDHHNSVQSQDPRREMKWLLSRLSPGVASLLPPSLCSKIQHTLATFKETYQRYTFGEVCVAFNGGKDCTAMLHLLHSYLTYKGHDFSRQKLSILYVTGSAQFPEVESFVEESVSHYSLDAVEISGMGIREALCRLKQSHPQFKAVMMGTRRTDPFSADLCDFSPTDSSWPEYMRINCLLEWSYMEVWMFLRTLSVPYCSLYDTGYSSLDGKEDTHPNAHLVITKDTPVLTGQPCVAGGYLPAYMLAREEHERAGRYK